MSTPLRLLALCVAIAVSSLAQAQDGSFTNAGLELHYSSTGTGQPLVFLSGGPGLGVDYMKPAADFVPSNYRRIFLEQRGTGRSMPAAPESLTLKTVVGDLEALRKHLKQDRLLLIGHSWGGMLAMAYAAEHPDHVDRLILIGSGGPTMEFFDWFGDNINARLRTEDREAANYWMAAMERGVDRQKAVVESLRARTPGYFFDRAKALQFAAKFSGDGLHLDTMNGLNADLAKEYDVRDGLNKLARPVLIVHGHQDPIGDKTAEDIHAVISSSTLVYINQCGHFPWLEQPERFREILATFLDKPSKPPGTE
jgi:proline iminopeptidase